MLRQAASLIHVSGSTKRTYMMLQLIESGLGPEDVAQFLDAICVQRIVEWVTVEDARHHESHEVVHPLLEGEVAGVALGGARRVAHDVGHQPFGQLLLPCLDGQARRLALLADLAPRQMISHRIDPSRGVNCQRGCYTRSRTLWTALAETEPRSSPPVEATG